MFAMHVAHSMQFFHIDFSIIVNFSHLIDIFFKFFTIKLHRYQIIDVAKSIWELWNTIMLSNYDVICTFVNIALFKQKIFASWCIFYSILNINFHIDVSHYEKHFEIQDVFSHSIARFTIRFYVIFEVNKSSNFDSFVFALFASMHDFITSKEFVRKFQTTHRWKIHIVKKVTSLRESHRWENHIAERVTSLKELARKFQIELVKILNKRHKLLLWKSVKNTIFANVAIKI